MEISYLREFVAVAKNENVTKTARLLGMSQPVLSKHIVNLEKEVGCQLFDRERNGFKLTPHGIVFLEDAQRLIIEYERTVIKMARLKNKAANHLSICTYVSYKPTDDLIKRCRQSLKVSDPLLTIDVRNVGPTSPIADVVHDVVDIALFSGNHREINDASVLPLFKEPLWAVMKRNHRLSTRRKIKPNDLIGDLIWCSHEAPVARHYLDIQDILEKAGVEADFMELPFNGSPDVMELNFHKGIYVDGAGIIAHSLSKLSLSNEYIAIPISDCSQLQHLAICKDSNPNPAIIEFIEELQRVLSDIDMSLYWQV